ncbi:MAG: hypothetical protein JKY88_09215 [Pseudomonadales bacterium]|nr:hypothetical protein [Pseudomonadales bacterium]
MTAQTPIKRDRNKKVNYNYPKFGAGGIFVTENSLPIEYLLTTIPIAQIEDLSLARDLESKTKNFDYLIQRDIDEERARKEICSYLADSEKGNAVFLPPLIAAVVEVDNDNVIKDYYPDCSITLNGKKIDSQTEIKDDEELIREWTGLFKVKNYVDSNLGVKLKSDDSISNISLDVQQVSFEMYMGKSNAGGRLVVIDGQHRLYALQYLLRNEPEKIKNLTIPLCIIYSPTTTGIQQSTVTGVLRKLFVDVNATVEKVSGHFLTLLSDDNIGSMICRELCSKVHNSSELNERGLGLLEWNTKKDKESKTISRQHSITSIGLIYETLSKIFYSEKGARQLKQFLDINSHNEDEMGIYYPWTGFNITDKSKLKGIVKEEVVDHLYRLFFTAKVYKASFEIFNEILDSKLIDIKEKRDSTSDCIPYIANYFLYNDPLPDFSERTMKSKCSSIISEIKQWHAEQIKLRSNPIAYMSIFQKSIINGWIELYLLLKNIGVSKIQVTTIYIKLMDETLINKLGLLEFYQPYMQDNIYNGPRVRATARSINQLKYLTLSFLGNEKILMELKDDLVLSSELYDRLKKLGKDNASIFFKSLVSEKQKLFSKNYKHNYSLTMDEKRSLSEAESQRNSDICSSDDASVKVEAAMTFDEMIKKMVEKDIKKCAEILSVKFGYSDFFYLVEEGELED